MPDSPVASDHDSRDEEGIFKGSNLTIIILWTFGAFFLIAWKAISYMIRCRRDHEEALFDYNMHLADLAIRRSAIPHVINMPFPGHNHFQPVY